MTIKQNSESWLKAKQSKIGGSSIYSLAHYYCKKELEQIGIDIIKEVPFKTALEEYLQHKFDIKQEPIPLVCSEFGLGLESYIINRIQQENQGLIPKQSKDFILNKDLHPLACCSPDGFVELSKETLDYDKKVNIDSSWGLGMLEVKTTPFSFNYEAEAGAKLAYLFQINYNMMVCGNECGLLSCLSPKEKEYDNDFFKGKTIGAINAAKMRKGLDLEIFEQLNEFYNLYNYIYPANKTIQNICKLALKRFQAALDNDDMPLAATWNKEKLMREKKMLAQMFPEKFGKINADEELDGLLNERGVINNEMTKITTEFEELNCKIIKKMQNNIEAEGFNYIAKFDKRGALRVRQNKNSDVTPKMIDELLNEVKEVNINLRAAG